MITDLNHYIKHFDNFLDKEICNQTIIEIEKCKWEQHNFYDNNEKKYDTKSGEQELDITWQNVPSVDVIMKKIWFALKSYIEYINFNWFDTWTGYSQIRFNRYTNNKKMAMHCDHIHSLFEGNKRGIPFLSVLGTLNDNYTGGDFIMFKDKKINLKQGDLIIFPSIFLYPHKVEPVTRGTRYSYISWVW